MIFKQVFHRCFSDMTRHVRRGATAFALAGLLIPAAALAQGGAAKPAAKAAPETAPATSSAWRFELGLYGWSPGLSGRLSEPHLPDLELQEGPFEALSDLQLAGLGEAVVRWRRLLLSAEVTGLDSISGHAWRTAAGQFFNRLPVKVNMDLSLVGATLAGGVAVLDRPDLSLDLLAGARLWHLSFDVKGGRRGRSDDLVGQSGFWGDPVVGARLRWRPLPQALPALSLRAVGDYGGFHLVSDQTWQARGLIDYALAPGVSVAVGWQAMGFNLSERQADLEATLSGPVAGLAVRF